MAAVHSVSGNVAKRDENGIIPLQVYHMCPDERGLKIHYREGPHDLAEDPLWRRVIAVLWGYSCRCPIVIRDGVLVQLDFTSIDTSFGLPRDKRLCSNHASTARVDTNANPARTRDLRLQPQAPLQNICRPI